MLRSQLLQDFLDSVGQFKRILEDSGFVKLTWLKNKDLLSDERKMGLIEGYCYLSEKDDAIVFKDIEFTEGIQIGNEHCQIYTLGDA